MTYYHRFVLLKNKLLKNHLKWPKNIFFKCFQILLTSYKTVIKCHFLLDNPLISSYIYENDNCWKNRNSNFKWILIDNPGEESLITTSSKKLTTHRKSSRSNSSKGLKSRSESVNGRFSVFVDPQGPDETDSLVGSSTICQDFIQNRLYLNKAMMNTVDKYLETIKLHQTLAELCEKIDLDKEILLVFTHLKQEEKYLSSLEPLQPLFRRYSLGFERCIQIWRRKCSADSLLLFNDRFNYQSKPCTANQQNQVSSIQYLFRSSVIKV